MGTTGGGSQQQAPAGVSVIARAGTYAILCTAVGVAGGACAEPRADADADVTADTSAAAAQAARTTRDSTDIVVQVTGLSGPEAVRYDPDQDVWFIANYGESGEEERDGNGYISRVTADGVIEELRFMTAPASLPLHAPRGMAIRGDSLWVADVDGVHAFDRHSGEHLHFIDMSEHEPGFINDLAFDDEGVLYATDTGRGRVYRIGADAATVAIEGDMTGPPNGITWDAERAAFLLAPWDGVQQLRAWDPATGELADVTELSGGNFDGIEIVDGAILIASQADSTLYLVEGGTPRVLARVPGRPADIGVDTRRGRVAVPYIALDRVDVWDIR